MSFSQLHLHQYLSLTEAQTQQQFLLWVPGEQVVSHRLQMPAAARRKWTETLPWMLEDQLIDKPENLHFSLGHADAESQVVALSVPRAQMDHWQTLCESGPGRVVSLVPDYLALPWEEGGLSLLVEGDRWVVRCGATEGYAGDETFVTTLLTNQMARQTGVPLSYIGPKERLPEVFQETGRHLADTLDWSFCDYPNELNLLRGEYRQASSWKTLRSWWPALAAVSLFLVLALGYLVADYHRMGKEVPLLQADLSTTYRALLGGAIPAANVRAATLKKMAFRENQYVATESFPLALLVELDAVLSGCNSCQIKSIGANERQITLRMSAGDPVLSRLAGMSGLQAQVTPGDSEVLVTVTPEGEVQ